MLHYRTLRANHLVTIGTPGDVLLFVIHKFVDNSKLLKILVSLGVLILHFIIMIAFYEMPEFERITDPYQPELADRSYNLTFCLSDYQEHSFDSCPGKRLAGQSEMEYSLVVRPVCKICYRGPTVWVGCTYQIPSVIGQGKVMIPQLLTAHNLHTSKRLKFATSKGIWVGFLNIFTNFFLLRTARMSYEHWYKKVRFLQRANIFSAIATASFDAYCTILYIDYLKYANHAKENHSKLFYGN